MTAAKRDYAFHGVESERRPIETEAPAAMDKRIGFGPRLGAWIIDIVAVSVVFGVVAVIFGGMLGAAAGAQQTGVHGASIGILLVAPVVGALYFLLEGITGATLGKM